MIYDRKLLKKNKEQGAKSKELEQRTITNQLPAKSKEPGTGNKEQRSKIKDQRLGAREILILCFLLLYPIKARK